MEAPKTRYTIWLLLRFALISLRGLENERGSLTAAAEKLSEGLTAGPSWRRRLEPKMKTSPLSTCTRLWLAPATSRDTRCPPCISSKSGRRIGTWFGTFSPALRFTPSWPNALDPSAHSRRALDTLSCVRMREWRAPSAMSTASCPLLVVLSALTRVDCAALVALLGLQAWLRNGRGSVATKVTDTDRFHGPHDGRSASGKPRVACASRFPPKSSCTPRRPSVTATRSPESQRLMAPVPSPFSAATREIWDASASTVYTPDGSTMETWR
mmetsp:Transcript_9454/g.27144  ORF Transcript_9454/g.27144 Transcript_9454/m.27144 type:complete len:269 (+) Transcript_9454:2704-3510(+)